MAASLISLRARARKDGLIFSSASQAGNEIASQPAAITSVRAVLPDPRAPMIGTRPGLSGMSGVTAQSASSILICEMTCDGIADGSGLADIGAAIGVDAGLAEGIELECALDPRKVIVDGLAHRFLVVVVTLPWRHGLQPSYRARSPSTVTPR